MIGTGSQNRSVLTQAVRPPKGYTLDAAVVCTYSLSLPSLLTLPTYVALGAHRSRDEALANPIGLIEALRRAGDRIDVFVHAGAVHAPRSQHILYSTLEGMIHEVRLGVPGSPFAASGAFHPKLWILRFTSEEADAPTRMRLLIASRNLTEDRSWDLSIILDGQEQGRARKKNLELRALLRALARTLPEGHPRRVRVASLAESLGRAEWEIPAPFDALEFVVLGLNKRRWRPEFERGRSRRLVVVSPFIDARSLEMLRGTTREATALISSPHALAKVGAEGVRGFGAIKVLAEHAESEDGEAAELPLGELSGLHAKLYLYQYGYRVRFAVGSANATPRALLQANNVEVMAVLEGPSGACGTPDQLLDSDKGIGEVLMDWCPPCGPMEVDASSEQARQGLEALRSEIVNAGLRVDCLAPSGEGLTLSLSAVGSPPTLRPGQALRAWPVTLIRARAVDAAPLCRGEAIALHVDSVTALTGLWAFEISHPEADSVLCFALNLPIRGIPEDRHVRIMESILKNTQGFLAYLHLLLGGGDGGEGELSAARDPRGGWGGRLGLGGDAPLLETLTRVLSREPARLEPVRGLIEGLSHTEEGRRLLSEDFMQLWRVIEPLLPPPEGRV